MENRKEENALNHDPMPVGRWTIDQAKCTVCCECIDACRRGLLYKEKNVILIKHENNCNQCGDCVDACGYGAIVLT